MNNFSSEMHQYSEALGLLEGDKKILDAMVLAGFQYELYDSPYDESCSYYCFYNTGIEFLFENKILKSIMFFVKGDDEYSAFNNIDRLNEGLTQDSNKQDVIDIFGKPDELSEGNNNWIKYNNEEKNLHFEFDDKDTIRKLTVYI